MKWFIFLQCLVLQVKADLRADGTLNIPIVVVIDLVEKRNNKGDEPYLGLQPNVLAARWSEKRNSDELDPAKIRPFEKLFGKPVLIGESQSAIVWVQARWTRGSGITSYNVYGNLILSLKGKEIYNKPLKELIKDPNKAKMNHGAMLVMIKMTVDELNGRKPVGNP